MNKVKRAARRRNQVLTLNALKREQMPTPIIEKELQLVARNSEDYEALARAWAAPQFRLKDFRSPEQLEEAKQQIFMMDLIIL
jgi:hypothetical protein